MATVSIAFSQGQAYQRNEQLSTLVDTLNGDNDKAITYSAKYNHLGTDTVTLTGDNPTQLEALAHQVGRALNGFHPCGFSVVNAQGEVRHVQPVRQNSPHDPSLPALG